MRIVDSIEKEYRQNNIIINRPEKIIVMDSYNNDYYPLTSISIDSNVLSIDKLNQELVQKHNIPAGALFMPWHYNVEFIGKEYRIMNTRPMNYKSLIPNNENSIIICISGNSDQDIYSGQFYKLVSHMILNTLHYFPKWKLSEKDIIFHNLGKGFKEDAIRKELR